MSHLDTVLQLLTDYDPIGIADPSDNPDYSLEYYPEAEAVSHRISEMTSPETAQEVIRDEMRSWFSDTLAGEIGRYQELGRSLWDKLKN